MKTIGIVTLLLVSLAPWQVARACTVSEIVKLVAKGSGSVIVAQRCSVVDNGPRCTIKQAVALAFDGKDEDEILNRCGLCKDPTCEVDPSWPVTLPSCGIKPGFKITDGCSCPSWEKPGTIWPIGGVACHN